MRQLHRSEVSCPACEDADLSAPFRTAGIAAGSTCGNACGVRLGLGQAFHAGRARLGLGQAFPDQKCQVHF
jgi:hypothetical protein